MSNDAKLSPEAKAFRHGVYRHFKGNEYQTLAIVRHSETEEEMVVYQHLYGDFSWWVRPLRMFLEEVDRDGYMGPRFVFVSQNR